MGRGGQGCVCVVCVCCVCMYVYNPSVMPMCGVLWGGEEAEMRVMPMCEMVPRISQPTCSSSLHPLQIKVRHGLQGIELRSVGGWDGKVDLES